MVNLVWKDFLLLKRYLWIAVLWGGVAPFIYRTINGGVAISVAIIGASYMLIGQACIRDDKNKSEIMLNSLPLRRRDIVLAKYLSVFFYATLAILSFLLAQGIMSVIGIPISISKISLEGIALALVNLIVLISLYFPIYFKLGYLRSNIVGGILFFACFFLPMSAVSIAHWLGGVGNPALRNIVAIMQRVVGWLQTQADWQISSYVLALALILMAASARLSLRFYTRREF